MPVNNNRIVKNTIILYFRMLLSIAINLYTVRVIWQVLGVDNYGIYNIVGGIVFMFAFLNNAMVASSQRFISFELGKGENGNLTKVFSVSVIVHFLLAIIILALAETVGLWFLNQKLNIPPGRMYAANWVYQCSILAFCVTVISVPYNATIVAHEHMKAYGYFGILDVLLKLGIVFMLMFIPGDKLIIYALLVLGVSVTMRFLYTIYCRKHFPVCRFHYTRDPHLIKDMFSFAGWSFLGNLGFSVRDQGLNILINMFFNVAVNAAKGIATQVGNVINGFAANFQMALNPQITKSYAANEKSEMMKLVFSGCKYSVMLLMVIVIPVATAAEKILTLWLGDVAPYTVGFLQLTLLMALVDSIVSPITTALQATGNIRKFQILISILMVLNIPLAWLWLRLGGSPYSVMIVAICMAVVAVATRLTLLHEQVPFSRLSFLRKVLLPLVTVFVIAAPLGYFIYPYFPDNFGGLIAYAILSVVITSTIIFVVGLSSSERTFTTNIIKKKLLRRAG